MKNLLAFFVFVLAHLSAFAAPIAVHTTDEDVVWLAKNVYFEARNQPTAGRMAVIMVTLNRVVSDKFPNTIKGVVTQRLSKRRCQFSWYCDGKSDKIRDWKTYNDILEMVQIMLKTAHSVTDITDGALFYHATYVRPKWSTRLRKTIQIGDHIFYK